MPTPCFMAASAVPLFLLRHGGRSGVEHVAPWDRSVAPHQAASDSGAPSGGDTDAREAAGCESRWEIGTVGVGTPTSCATKTPQGGAAEEERQGSIKGLPRHCFFSFGSQACDGIRKQASD